MATTREQLHALLDTVPEDRLDAIEAALLDAITPYCPLTDAPEDDEPVTEEDLAAIREGREAYARGEWVADDDLARKHGW